MCKFLVISCLLFFGLGFSGRVCGMVIPATGSDTVKYTGYRLDLTNFEVLKKNDDWIKIRFTAINSGREDIDFKRQQIAHWVQVNFASSLFECKLGGFRKHIKYALVRKHFALKAGEVKRKVELKVSTLPPPEETPLTMPTEEPEPSLAFSEKGGTELPDNTPEIAAPEACPDILFTELKIAGQDDKWATLEYTILNQGEGPFRLFGKHNGVETNLVLRAYISGVPVLSKGALPIGGQFVQELPGRPKELLSGQSFSGKIKLDVRKKTRYMKSLILSLDSNQFAFECDRTNNTGAVILE
ncbi:MAG: hypothetical protein ACE5FF_15430 [Saprospiraceae bacterium]